jgi:hypothetical protein
MIDARRELGRFFVGERGDARLDFIRGYAMGLQLRLHVGALEHCGDAMPRGRIGGDHAGVRWQRQGER